MKYLGFHYISNYTKSKIILTILHTSSNKYTPLNGTNLWDNRAIIPREKETINLCTQQHQETVVAYLLSCAYNEQFISIS